MSYPKPNEPTPPAFRMVEIKMDSWSAGDALYELKKAIEEKRVVTSESRGNVLGAIEAIEEGLRKAFNQTADTDTSNS